MKTAVETADQKNEIIQLELLATGLPKIHVDDLLVPSKLNNKPDWIESDSIWLNIVALSNLFSDDDLLFHLSDSILSNNEQWKICFEQIQFDSIPNPSERQYSILEKLLIIRILREEYFLQYLHEYLIERFNLNNLKIDEMNFRGVHIMNFPLNLNRSIKSDELLMSQYDFDEYFQMILSKDQGRKISRIDLRTMKNFDELNDENDLYLIENIIDRQTTFSNLIKQIHRKF